MNRKEVTEIFSVMMLAWPNAEMFKGGIRKLESTIGIWTLALSDVDFWIGQQAVIRLCKTCKFPPTIAELREAAEAVKESVRNEIEHAYFVTKNEVWIADGDLTAAYNRLPPRCRKTINAMGGMEAFAPPDSPMFRMDAFCKTYRRLLKSNPVGLPSAEKKALNGKKG